MSYFEKFVNQKGIDLDSLCLWKYPLSDKEFYDLKKEIQFSEDINKIDPRDITLYYAEWWRKCYNGGKPEKEIILNSVGGNAVFNFEKEIFYEKAKEGAEMLKVKWIKKQNTLYFRTLLLLGGLPLHHISKNESHYKNFLLAVLEIQPSSVEDFSSNPDIIKYLPESSRNDFIYENCFEIVRAILNGDSNYDNILEQNDSIRRISDELKNRRKTLRRKSRETKLQNYWFYDAEKNKISLRIESYDEYQKDELSNILGFEAESKNYQLYIENQLVCEFSRMLNGNYKTYKQNFKSEWEGENELPDCYVIFKKDSVSQKERIKDFIQLMPNLTKPTLWKLNSKDEWVLVKGNTIPNEKGLLLFPKDWHSKNQNQYKKELYRYEIVCLEFENEEIIYNEEKGERIFRTNKKSFDWIISEQNPKWILKSDMVVVNRKPEILLYNDNGERINSRDYQVFVRNNKNGNWLSISESSLLIGCNYLKIEYDGVTAYDKFYNIGNLSVDYSNQTVDKARVTLSNSSFKLFLKSNQNIDVSENGMSYDFTNRNRLKIPKSIKAKLSFLGSSKSLSVELSSPFEGIALVDGDGNLVSETDRISYQNLYGLRLVKSSKLNTFLRLKNSQNGEVVISKEITIENQPMISFKDDILRLFNLEDVMSYKNSVVVELVSEKTKKIIKRYEIFGFSHILNVENQLQGKVKLENSDDFLELHAIPLNCPSEEIKLLPLHFENNEYYLPKVEFSKQFIIISAKNSDYQLMPRFINTDENLQKTDRNDRIQDYHNKLKDSKLDSLVWKELLAYFNICNEQNLPFSTLDQIRAIGLSSEVAVKAFFYLALYQSDREEYIRKIVPKIEQNLGFCFHWANKEDWQKVIENDIIPMVGEGYLALILEILSDYLKESGLDVFQYISQNFIQGEAISHPELIDVRGQLGERVLKELPQRHPFICNQYNIPINEHSQVALLIKSPIAVAESIMGKNDNRLWRIDETAEIIKKNIQYSHFLTPDLYRRIINWVISQEK